jgi:predicted Zn-dependent peptidase
LRLRCAAYILLLSAAAYAQNRGNPDRRVTGFTLNNGMRFVVLERHQSPVIAFHTLIGGGSADEPAGQSGMTQLLSRLALKGSESIGTRNWAEERKAIEAADEARERMEAERNKGPLMNQSQFETLRAQWRMAVDTASRFGQPAEYAKILQDSGATGVFNSADWGSMQFGYTLPSNRAELWFSMEAQRLQYPVLRDFEKERADLIEGLSKNQNNVQQRMLEAMLATAFAAHPYRVPRAGWPSDLAELKRSDAMAFYRQRLVPGNIVAAMVGDIDPAEARRLAEKYFGGMPARPLPPVIHTEEPPQRGPKTAMLEIPAQSIGAIAYKRPSYFDKDDAAFDVLHALLSGGKSGLLSRELVEEKKLAAAVQAFASFPEGRYANLFLFILAPSPGHSVEDNQRAIEDLLTRMRVYKAGLEGLPDARVQAQALAYSRLANSNTFAQMLAIYTATYGDWTTLFTGIENLGKVTDDDVIRVLQRYFTSANRTTVYTGVPGPPAAPKRGDGQ